MTRIPEHDPEGVAFEYQVKSQSERDRRSVLLRVGN
jgi:hypothetical protein